jgi:hypothetical protein
MSIAAIRSSFAGAVQRSAAPAEAARSSANAPAADDVPDQPKPLTPATMAVHIMQVPSSHLLAAFVAMQRALGQQEKQDEVPAPDTRHALTVLAKKLSAALEPSAAVGGGAGVDLEA